MTDWKKVKCTKCDHKNICKRKSISKGSDFCQVNLKIREPTKKEESGPSTSAYSNALLWQFAQKRKRKGEKEEEQETIEDDKNLLNEEAI
jgi:hypothetical protein